MLILFLFFHIFLLYGGVPSSLKPLVKVGFFALLFYLFFQLPHPNYDFYPMFAIQTNHNSWESWLIDQEKSQFIMFFPRQCQVSKGVQLRITKSQGCKIVSHSSKLPKIILRLQHLISRTNRENFEYHHTWFTISSSQKAFTPMSDKTSHIRYYWLFITTQSIW